MAGSEVVLSRAAHRGRRRSRPASESSTDVHRPEPTEGACAVSLAAATKCVRCCLPRDATKAPRRDPHNAPGRPRAHDRAARRRRGRVHLSRRCRARPAATRGSTVPSLARHRFGRTSTSVYSASPQRARRTGSRTRSRETVPGRSTLDRVTSTRSNSRASTSSSDVWSFRVVISAYRAGHSLANALANAQMNPC